VVQDWRPLDIEDSQGWTLVGGPDVINDSNFTNLSWTQGVDGRWTITFDDASIVDGYEELPQLQFLPSAIFEAALANGQTIQIAVKLVSADVPTGYGVGPAVGAIYGTPGQASVGSLDGGCVMAVALEGGGAGNARSADCRSTSEVVREEFDWPTDYGDAGVIFEITSRQDEVGVDRTALAAFTAYLSGGSAFFADATAGSPYDIDPADLILMFGFYSRFDTTPAGGGPFEIIMEQPQYRLLDPEVFP
jgi:hypothetical protein